MQGNKVSVIIPAYNVGKYIIATIQSVLKQTYSNIEVIVVNDGSTDNTKNEIESINDCRLKLINQENRGVSIARNVGIDHATGNYIAFLDGDDRLKPEAIKTLLESTDNNSQLITSDYEVVNELGKFKYSNVGKTKYKITLDEALSSIGKIGCLDECHFSSACYKLFNREIINDNNIRFDTDIYYGEDGLFVFEYLLHCSSINYIPVINWIITDRSTSATNAPYNSKWLTGIDAAEIMISHMSDSKYKNSLGAYCVIKALNIKLAMALTKKVPSVDIKIVNDCLDTHRREFLRCNNSMYNHLKIFCFRYFPLKLIKTIVKG